jgi:hypothetical protein
MTPPAEAGLLEDVVRPVEGRPATARPAASRLHWHAAALAGYAVIAVVFIDHGESLTGAIAGQGSDPFAFVWFLAWWPWAIAHHLNPLVTHLVWVPEGVYLAWVTSVPLLGFIGWPLTMISPVLTFNVFVLGGPVLAAWMAYFLCLKITRQPPAAIIGGFLFGFSSYEMAQDTAALNLSFTACVPLLLLIVLVRLDGGLNRAQTMLSAGLVLVCQFLLCIEIFAMIFVFGGIAWGLSLVYLPARRPALRRLAIDGLWAAPLVLLALSPFLVSMALHAGSINLPAGWPYYFVADPLNFFIPNRGNLLGGLLRVSTHFNGGLQEQDGYIGLPLLLIIGLFARQKFHAPAARFLLLMFVLLLVASLGPRLWVGGQLYRAALPWSLAMHLPLLHSALPTRFALFVSLLAAIIAVLWISDAAAGRQRRVRVMLGLLACVVLLPQFHPWMRVPASKFFSPGRVEAVLGKNANLLVLPFSINGPSSLWQAQSNFGFVQTGGYLGFPPRRMQQYPAVFELFGGSETASFPADITSFCKAAHTQFIVAGPATAAPQLAAFAGLYGPGRKIDDVTIFTLPQGAAPHG